MTALTLYLILKIDSISAMLLWGSVLYLLYVCAAYARIWLDSVIGEDCWTAFWAVKRRKASAAAIVMIVAMAMPSTKEAVIMHVVPAVAQSGVWDRLFGGGINKDTIAQAQKWVQNSSR